MGDQTFRVRRCRNCQLVQQLPPVWQEGELYHCAGCRVTFDDETRDYEDLGTVTLTASGPAPI